MDYTPAQYSSSYTLGALDVKPIGIITSLLEGFALFKLYACGDGRLNRTMENGGVYRIRMDNPLENSVVKVPNSSSTTHPNFWHTFKYIREIEILKGLSFPSHSKGNNALNLHIPSHLIPTLTSLTLCVSCLNSMAIWHCIMKIGNDMHCLERLNYSETMGTEARKYSDEELTFLLPDSINHSLTHLEVRIGLRYHLNNLPPNLVDLRIEGEIADFEREKIATLNAYMTQVQSAIDMLNNVANPSSQLVALTLGMSETLDEFKNFERNHNTDKKIQHDSTLFGLFPQNLTMLSFACRYLRRQKPLSPTLESLNFYRALPPTLRTLQFSSYSTYKLDVITHLLPRGLRYLGIHNRSHSQQPLISIADLPPSLEYWGGDCQPKIRDDLDVDLPKSLTAICFEHGFDRLLWERVRYPNLHLRIKNCKCDINDPIYFGHMIESLDRTIDPDPDVYIRNCRFLTLKLPRNGALPPEFVFPAYLVGLTLSRLPFSKVTDDFSADSDRQTIFDLLPKTLLYLMLNTTKSLPTPGKRVTKSSKTATTTFTLGLEAFLVKYVTPDIGTLLPNLVKFVIDGYSPDNCTFRPKSLPQTLKIFVVEGTHHTMLGDMMLMLPSSIEQCAIDGDVEDDKCDDFVPPHIGSTSPSGVTLTLMFYNFKKKFGRETTLDSLADTIRSRNDHLNSLRLVELSPTGPSLSRSYHKRVEHG